MKREGRTIWFLICLMCSVDLIAAQPPGRNSRMEPRVFSLGYQENDPFEDAKAPTNVMLDVLLRTPEVRMNSGGLRGLNRENLRKLFRIVQIHLAETDEIDWLVNGRFPMTGADCEWFWIVQTVRGNTKVILFANTNSLELLAKSTNGLNDVRTVWSSAAGYALTDIYHFDGAVYRRIHAFTKTDKLP